MPPLVGIFGAGRNGSTLLMRLLDGSRELWVHPIEVNYFSNENRFSDWTVQQMEELQSGYVERLLEPLGLGEDSVSRVLEGVENPTEHPLRAFLEAVRTEYDSRPDGKAASLVFKSIEVLEIERYARLFPDLRFIHILRDPLSNYASLKRTDMLHKQKPFWFQGGDILRLQVEGRWIPHARWILQNCESDGRRHLLVRYEDLCSGPDQAIGRICEWLGVHPPADPALQTVLGGRRMKELPSNPSKAGVKTPDRVVADMAKAFRYEEVVTDREREFIRLRTRFLAEKLGYPDRGDRPISSRWRMAMQWLFPDRWELLNARPKVRLAAALLSRRWYIYSRIFSPEPTLQ